MFSTFEHFDLTITSGNKVFRLVTVYRPPPSRKNGFTVERFFSEFSSFLEELTVTSYQFLLCGDFNFHVDDNGNANAKQFHDPLFSADLKQHVNGPTHRLGHTLDLLITREMDTLILPDPLSDHQVVVCFIHLPRPPATRITVTRRKTRDIDLDAFQKDICSVFSKVSVDDLDGVITVFDDTLRLLLN